MNANNRLPVATETAVQKAVNALEMAVEPVGVPYPSDMEGTLAVHRLTDGQLLGFAITAVEIRSLLEQHGLELSDARIMPA